MSPVLDFNCSRRGGVSDECDAQMLLKMGSGLAEKEPMDIETRQCQIVLRATGRATLVDETGAGTCA